MVVPREDGPAVCGLVLKVKVRLAGSGNEKIRVREVHPVVRNGHHHTGTARERPRGAHVQVHARLRAVDVPVFQVPLVQDETVIEPRGVRPGGAHRETPHGMRDLHFGQRRQSLRLARCGPRVRRLQNEPLRSQHAIHKQLAAGDQFVHVCALSQAERHAAGQVHRLRGVVCAAGSQLRLQHRRDARAGGQLDAIRDRLRITEMKLHKTRRALRAGGEGEDQTAACQWLKGGHDARVERKMFISASRKSLRGLKEFPEQLSGPRTPADAAARVSRRAAPDVGVRAPATSQSARCGHCSCR